MSKPSTYDKIEAICLTCCTKIYWAACPAGGWWDHYNPDVDNHDATTLVQVDEEMNDDGIYVTHGLRIATTKPHTLPHWSTLLPRLPEDAIMSSTTALPALNVGRAVALAAILSAAQTGARVVLLDEDSTQKRGTARHIVKNPGDYGFLGNDDDVRNGYLRITMQTGVEMTLKVSDLMEKLNSVFFIHDWSEDD